MNLKGFLIILIGLLSVAVGSLYFISSRMSVPVINTVLQSSTETNQKIVEVEKVATPNPSRIRPFSEITIDATSDSINSMAVTSTEKVPSSSVIIANTSSSVISVTLPIPLPSAVQVQSASSPAPVIAPVDNSVLKITSDAFVNNGRIPARYTCDGSYVLPTLNFVGVPKTAKSLAIIVDDPDAPDGTFTHWIIWNIDPTTTTIGSGSLPMGSVEGYNGAGMTGWYAPCPPFGTHRYNFKLYALDVELNISEDSRKADLVNIITGRIISAATLVGFYGN